MKLYRILTEDVGNLTALVTEHFGSGATILYCFGLWEGQSEESIVIEIMAPQRDYQRVLALAKAIKVQNDQAAVLVQTFDVESEMV